MLLLGRKIIEHYPDDSPHSSPKLKSRGLSIEVEKCGLDVKGNRFSVSKVRGPPLYSNVLSLMTAQERANFSVRTRESLISGISPA